MQVPVVHAGSVLPLPELIEGGQLGGQLAEGRYVREVAELDYAFVWVDLLEMDGVAPYTYSEELPFDDLLQQHSAGVQERSGEERTLVVAALPRADSPSAARYVREREGETAWTMALEEEGEGASRSPSKKAAVPSEVATQITERTHTDRTSPMTSPSHGVEEPDARAWDEPDVPENEVLLPGNYKAPRLDE